MTLDAIPVEYKGWPLRSRLEGRWAVFFDCLNLNYSFEREGFDLGHGLGWYVPDFYLLESETWVEIKPKVKGKEKERMIAAKKCWALARQTGERVILVVGYPDSYKCYLFWKNDRSISRPLKFDDMFPDIAQQEINRAVYEAMRYRFW